MTIFCHILIKISLPNGHGCIELFSTNNTRRNQVYLIWTFVELTCKYVTYKYKFATSLVQFVEQQESDQKIAGSTSLCATILCFL